jgi:molybdenum cofactor synthesis domain-containing protein
MQAEIIAIGSELLLGVTVDTNTAYLARHLTSMGIDLTRHTTVGDTLPTIVAAMNDALQRADVIFCTGGLGPTLDDLTRDAVAQALDRPLEFRQELLDQVAARFAAMQRPMSESNRVQAYVPMGARSLENRHGTAPAFLVEDARGTVIVLPGVPMEMRVLFEQHVVPYLREERKVQGTTLVHTYHVVGLGESVIGERIADLMCSDNPSVGTSAKHGRCEIRIAAKADSTEQAEALLASVITGLGERLGDYLVGTETPVEQVSRLLREQQQTLALYENLWQAPCYRMFGIDTLSQVQGVWIDPLSQLAPRVSMGIGSEAVQARAVALAHAGAVAVHERWQTSLGMGLAIAESPDEPGFAEVAVVLVVADAGGDNAPITEHRRYDLRQPEALDYAGNLALHVLRTYLLKAQPA